MRPRALLLTLLLVGGFWYITTHGNWSVAQLLRPISASGRLWSEPVTAHGAGFGADEQNNIDIYKTAHLATVNITSVVYQRNFFFQVYPQQGMGSGFIINDGGEIITNKHVIAGSSKLQVTLSDQTTYDDVQVLGIDSRDDLAILKINAKQKLPFLPLGDSDRIQVGQKVLAIGNPFGLGGTLTTGIVSSLGRELDNEDGVRMQGLIQTDAAINPGNSGGPLLDSNGNVIGINTAIYGSQTASGQAGSIGIGFAMPIARAKAMLEEFRTTGHVSHAVLGVQQTAFIPAGRLAQALDLPPSGGLLIQQIQDGSPADRAGLKGPQRVVVIGMNQLGIGGDLIVAIDGKPVEAQDALVRIMSQKRAADSIELLVFRDGGTKKVNIKLGSEPDKL